MNKELKTLKDIEGIDREEFQAYNEYVHCEDLRQEAIKWAKHYSGCMLRANCATAWHHYRGCKEATMIQNNLTNEDLQ